MWSTCQTEHRLNEHQVPNIFFGLIQVDTVFPWIGVKYTETLGLRSSFGKTMVQALGIVTGEWRACTLSETSVKQRIVWQKYRKKKWNKTEKKFANSSQKVILRSHEVNSYLKQSTLLIPYMWYYSTDCNCYWEKQHNHLQCSSSS